MSCVCEHACGHPGMQSKAFCFVVPQAWGLRLAASLSPLLGWLPTCHVVLICTIMLGVSHEGCVTA